MNAGWTEAGTEMVSVDDVLGVLHRWWRPRRMWFVWVCVWTMHADGCFRRLVMDEGLFAEEGMWGVGAQAARDHPRLPV